MFNNIPRNSPFWFFAKFIIVSLTCFINKPDSSSGLTILIISFISSFEVINVVTSNQNIFWRIAASVADADANNANGIKTLSANGLSTFPVRGKPVFGMALKVYLKATWLSFFM